MVSFVNNNSAGARSPVEAIKQQVVDEVDDYISRVGRFLEPDGDVEYLRRAATSKAAALAEDLVNVGSGEAVVAAMHLIRVFWPDLQPPKQWWGTPLGRAIVAAVPPPHTKAVSFSVAGAMLELTKPGIQHLVKTGKLDQDAVGSITTESITRVACERTRYGGF